MWSTQAQNSHRLGEKEKLKGREKRRKIIVSRCGKLNFLKKRFSLWNCSVAGQILFLTCMDGFCPLINPVRMFQMAIASALYFDSFTTFRGSWGLTFPLENTVLFLHPFLVSQKALKDKFCRVLPCQQRAQQYWDLQVVKLHQRKSTMTNRSQIKILGWFWSFLSHPVLSICRPVPPSYLYCAIAIHGCSQSYQKRPLLWGVCSLEPHGSGSEVECLLRIALRRQSHQVKQCTSQSGVGMGLLFVSRCSGPWSNWGRRRSPRRNEGQRCCRSPLHPVSAAFGSPTAIPSNASSDWEVMQPRVIKWCACLSLSPFYSQ